MPFSIQPITDKKLWDNFLKAVSPHTFLQSWEWGGFNQAMGNKIWRIGISDRELLAVALIIKIKARRASFLFCPHGPIASLQFKVQSPAQTAARPIIERGGSKCKVFLKDLTNYLKSLAQKESCSFIRISSLLNNNQDNQKLFRELKFRRAPIFMHPETAWLLNLRSDEGVEARKIQDKLFSQMRKTHRNLIRRAEKEGVKIIKSDDIAYLDVFNQLYQGTAKRQKFTPFSREYLQKEFAVFKKANKAKIFLAQWQNKYLAGALIIFDNNSAFYHQGASNRQYANIPASYLLQWQAIIIAIEKGLKYYNFWGIAPENKARHPWRGLTLFKQGFGGFREDYLPAQDLILKSSYWLAYIIERFRKRKRRL